MLPGPTRHRVAVTIALVGVALSLLAWRVSSALESDAGYTSFCNLSGVVNCDVVLSSRWGKAGGIPVGLWAAAAFAVGAALALPGALGRGGTGVADLALLMVAAGSLGFASVLAVVSLTMLHAVCLICLTMDAVIVAWFVTVAPLARRFAPSTRAPFLERRTAAYVATAAGLLVAIAGGTVEATRAPATARTLAEVEAIDPKFVDVYSRLPVLPADEVMGASRPTKGQADSGVTIVEFSDFQCPACAQAFRDLRDLAHARPDVRMVFRHFPLDSSCNDRVQHAMHPDACGAAVAAECAAQLGHFWEYHDLLFANQRALDRDSLFRYARELGLDIPSFRTCLDAPETLERVKADIAAGNRAGVTSTPTIFINGRRVAGALERPYYDFALVIEKEGHAHGGPPPQGGS